MLAFLWVLVILAIGIAANVVMCSLSLSLRYRRRQLLMDLVWILYSHSIGLLVIVYYLTYGFTLMCKGQALDGGSILSGLFIGFAIFCALPQRSEVSGTDQYLTITSPLLRIGIEGRTYRRWSPLISPGT